MNIGVYHNIHVQSCLLYYTLYVIKTALLLDMRFGELQLLLVTLLSTLYHL